ncbi:DUF3644 domain-containing protein [Nonomuraea terrae]|uniref:DUF3644 domain-containing protein n=1 Tax=Nonomuraea terrae TaxID=2530383 RepID=UPI0037A4F40F
MKLKQEARVLKKKALSSLVAATEAFNSPHDIGRSTKVLLHLQHSFEMLIKAALVQANVMVFDSHLGRSWGFETCIKHALGHPKIQLSDSDAGTLRAIDAMRDDEQHWFNFVSEQLLYLHARAGVTLFDDILQRMFKEELTTYLPHRVLPISVDPPRDLALVLDEEYTQIAALMSPGRRARHEACARIRTLLAMEAHVEPDTRVSTKDVARVERGIRNGNPRELVFPRLEEISTTVDGHGITITVHFTKKQGAPVRYVADDTVPAAAIREVDLQRKFHRSATDLAIALKLTGPRSAALRQHLGIDANESCSHEFVFGSQRHRRYSDNAFVLMRDALVSIDMEAVWQAHKPRGKAEPATPCSLTGCRAAV